MTFTQSIQTCLGPKYLFVFKGRASRSEFWWFSLFVFLLTGAGSVIFSFFSMNTAAIMNLLLSLLIFPANLGVAVRRFHDRDLTGWLLLLPMLSLLMFGIAPGAINTVTNLLSLGLGLLYLIILCMPSQMKINRYGPPPVEVIKG